MPDFPPLWSWRLGCGAVAGLAAAGAWFVAEFGASIGSRSPLLWGTALALAVVAGLTAVTALLPRSRLSALRAAVAACGRRLRDAPRNAALERLGPALLVLGSLTAVLNSALVLSQPDDPADDDQGAYLHTAREIRATGGPLALVGQLLRSEFAVSPAAEARGVTAPVGIFQGEKDLQVTVLDATLLAAAAPHAELHLYPDLTHNLVETDGPARSAALPGPDALVSTRLTNDIADFLTHHLARGG